MPGSEAEGDVETRVDGLAKAVAARTAHIALKEPTKGAVNDAVTLEERRPACTGVRRVQKRN